MAGRTTPDISVSAARLSEFLHATLHAVGGANGQIHRIAGLLEGDCGDLEEGVRSWLAHLTIATRHLDERLQAVRRYTEIFDLPRTISRFPLRDALSAARVSISGDCTLGVGDLPDVDADARRLQLLFKELLSNACKFHGGGIPEVGISVTNSREGLVVSFDDNGIGIEPNQVERIFVPFVRLLGDRFPGAGMGLAIARELVEGWGGRIWVESRPGAGSSFRFTLPHG